MIPKLDVPQETVEAVSAKASAGMMYGGSGATVVGYFTLNDWAMIVGIVVGVVGLAANIWFKWREDQRSARYWATREAGGVEE